MPPASLMGIRYPRGEWVPWEGGAATAYRGLNNPIACVLHVAQGWQTTAREWAKRGHFRASRHFSIGFDGSVMQHLEFADGGFHAGIPASRALAYPPTWPLWRGPHKNVNHYTLGIEHEGFAVIPATGITNNPQHQIFAPVAQQEASKDVCRWIANTMDWPLDEAHFPPHAAIDLRDRANDFGTPEYRAWWYRQLLEDDMDPTESFLFYRLLDLLLGDPPANTSDANGWRKARAIELADTNDFDVFKLIHNQNTEIKALQAEIAVLKATGGGGAFDPTVIYGTVESAFKAAGEKVREKRIAANGG